MGFHILVRRHLYIESAPWKFLADTASQGFIIIRGAMNILGNHLNIMPADALAPSVARVPAAMMLTVKWGCCCLPWEKISSTSSISILRKDIKSKYILCFLKNKTSMQWFLKSNTVTCMSRTSGTEIYNHDNSFILTHWGLVKWHHMTSRIFVIIGSGNGLVPDSTKPLPEPMLTKCQLGTNFSEFKILQFSFKKMHLKMSSAK